MMPSARIVIDRSYLLHEKLGEGGMGAVYRATRRVNGDVVALKLVGAVERDADEDDGSRYELRLALAREFQTLSSLHHPHIVQVLDYGFDDALGPYFTMELLRAPLSAVAAAKGKSVSQHVKLLAELCRALAYLHRRGIVHRDIKPSNVLFANNILKVVDFGIATASSSTPTDEGDDGFAGTLAYMAPELFLGAPPSIASDLFAVGVLALEMFDEAPHEGDNLDATLTFSAGSTEQAETEPLQAIELGQTTPVLKRNKVAEQQSVRLSTLTQLLKQREVNIEGPLGDVMRRLVAQEPEDRYQTVAELLHDLGRAIGETLPVETAETRESFLSASEFIGREAEIDVLQSALASVVAGGSGRAFLVGGESGVGKSRLTAELRTIAMVKGACVVEGQAVSTGGGSHQVWLAALRTLCLRAELPESTLAVLKELLPDLEALLERTIEDAPRLPHAAAQTRLLGAIEALFRAQEKPTVVLVEDLQWAGLESIELLDRLSRLAAEIPLLIVGNYRNDEAPALAASLPNVVEIKLSRLDSHRVGKLAASMLGRAGEDAALVEYLCRETEGNVFFLVEVVRALAEQAGQLDRVCRTGAPDTVLTGGIEKVALRRVDRVPDEAKPLLELAATLGRQLDLTVLEQAAPGVDLRAFLVTCANAAVLETSAGGEWRFAHDKLREAILAHIEPARLKAHHRVIGETMEAVYEGLARDRKSASLAHHFEQAGDDGRAGQYHLRAGEIATRVCAYEEARRHYAASLSAIDRLEINDSLRRRKIDVLLKLVYTRLVADSAEQNFARMAEARALLDALAASGSLDAEDKLRLARVNYLVGRIHFYRGEAREAIQYYREVLPFAKESGDPELLALPSCLIGTAMLAQGNMRKAESFLGQSIAPLEQLGEPFEWFRAVGYHGSSLIALGRYKEGIADLERVLARAREIGQPSLASAAHLMSGSAYLFSGDWPLVLGYHTRVLELAERTGDKLHLSLAHSSIAWAQSHLGQHTQAAAHRVQGQEIARAMGGRLMLADWYEAADAEMALLAGRVDEALMRAEAVAKASATAQLPFSHGVAERVWGAALALSGDMASAARHFAKSVEVLEASGSMLQAARSHTAWAFACHAAGDEGAASEHLGRAREIYSRAACDYALGELNQHASARGLL